MPRAIIAEDHVLDRIEVHHDGSVLASSFIIYSISKKKDQENVSLVRVGARLSKRSVPVTEHLSQSLALQSLLEVLSPSAPFFKKLAFSINIGGDSTCSSYLMTPAIKSSFHLLMANSLLQKNIIREICAMFPQCTVNLYFVPTEHNLANPVSKLCEDLVKLMNSGRNRRGEGVKDSIAVCC